MYTFQLHKPSCSLFSHTADVRSYAGFIAFEKNITYSKNDIMHMHNVCIKHEWNQANKAKDMKQVAVYKVHAVQYMNHVKQTHGSLLGN